MATTCTGTESIWLPVLVRRILACASNSKTQVRMTSGWFVVSSREEFFQNIKAVHIASASRLDSNRFPFFSNVCPFVLSENHNKDISLYKACQLKYGSSIPRCATNLFVKSCPICISHVHLKKKKVAGFQPIINKGFHKRGQVSFVLILTF